MLNMTERAIFKQALIYTLISGDGKAKNGARQAHLQILSEKKQGNLSGCTRFLSADSTIFASFYKSKGSRLWKTRTKRQPDAKGKFTK